MIEDPLFFLNHQSYGTYNRPLACAYGIGAAVILAELIEKRQFHRESLVDDPKHGSGWLYHTLESLESRTGLSKHEQASALNKLIEAGFIEAKVFGLPCRRHFRLFDDVILQFFGLSVRKCTSQKVDSQGGKERKLVCRKTETRMPENGIKNAGKRNRSIYNNTKEKIPKNTHTPNPLHSGNAAGAACVGVFPDQEMDKREKRPYGPEGNVHLTPRQYEDLLKFMPSQEREQWILDIDVEIAKVGVAAFNRKYKSHYHTILSWKRYREQHTPKPLDSNIAHHRRNSKLRTAGDADPEDFRRARL